MAHFSFSSSLYDGCNLDTRNNEATAPFSYMTDSTVIESPESCFLAGASPFMHNHFHSIPSTSVDVESELRNQNRNLSRCPEQQYNPQTAKPVDYKLKECTSAQLVPEYTRINKPCNIFAGITINRFHPLCDEVQQLSKIQSNSYIGTNTRLQVKDTYKTIQDNNIRPSFDLEHDSSKPCMVNGIACSRVSLK